MYLYSYPCCEAVDKEVAVEAYPNLKAGPDKATFTLKVQWRGGGVTLVMDESQAEEVSNRLLDALLTWAEAVEPVPMPEPVSEEELMRYGAHEPFDGAVI